MLRVRRADGTVDELGAVDVVLPILHGVHGEDGTVQGFFDTLGIPYAGGGVLDSALCMDKHFMKIVLQAAGVPVSPWVTVTRARWERDPEGVRADAATLGEPVFVKPARAGSSVGVSKVHDAVGARGRARARVRRGREGAHRDGDRRPRGRGRDPRGARRRRCPGVASRRDRADDPRVLRLRGQVPRRRRRGGRVPGRSDRRRDRARCSALGIRAFEAVDGRGLARVDFFLAADELYVNELNTMPGLHADLDVPEVLDRVGDVVRRAHLRAHRHGAGARRGSAASR